VQLIIPETQPSPTVSSAGNMEVEKESCRGLDKAGHTHVKNLEKRVKALEEKNDRKQNAFDQ